jgi:hypothetical protein
MLVPFEELPGTARVWIYQSNRPLSEQEVAQAESALAAFCQQWAAHGAPLKASFLVAHHQFIVLSVDESHHQASGCSIDSSVAAIRSIENNLGTSFFDRSQVAFFINGEVYMHPLPHVKSKIQQGEITPQTPVFNNLVASKQEWEEAWLAPSASSWLARYF